jgi:1-acyl-sn-glycerol-3-phosphate acyltransferase
VPATAPPNGILPGNPNPRVGRVLRWYARRLVRKRFHAVRIARGSPEVLAPLGNARRPAILMLTHASWWDPIVAILLWDRFLPARTCMGPMHRRELERFSFFRRVGMFGVDPDDPASLEAMRHYVMERFTSPDPQVLMLTPQGVLTDPRAPLRLRPGAAAIAAACGDSGGAAVDAVAVAVEYGFWLDQRPEIFLRAAAVEPPPGDRPSTAQWHRAMQDAMAANATALADLVIARDPGRFEHLAGGDGGIHPLYDWWLRLRGRSGAIDADGRSRRGPKA